MRQKLQQHLADDLRKIARDAPDSGVSAAGLHSGERRDVAVLFLDISGFTSLAEKIDFELVHMLVNGIMRTFSGIVSGNGGYVDKLEGDRIMAIFGAEQACDNDSLRAVDCSIKMLDAMEQVNGILAEEGISVGARAGVSCGQVIVAPDACGHLTATGDVVNVASRLEGWARTGSVVVSGAVREMCGDFFVWEDLGEVPIRGRALPVRAFTPVGPGEARLQRWERAARITGTPLLGRTCEMEMLSASWQGAPRGQPTVLEIRGEPGIGKSRLLHEFTTGLAGTAWVITGRNFPCTQPSMGLWSSFLKDAVAAGCPACRGGAGTLEVLLNGLSETAARPGDRSCLGDSRPFLEDLLFPETGDPSIEGMSQDSRRKETMIALRNLVELASRSSDIAVVLEDLHWMDNASGEILEFLFESLKPSGRVVFLLSTRTEGSFAFKNRRWAPMDLDPLKEEHGRQIIQHMLDGGAHHELVGMVLARSGGNPFFIEEMVLDLIESGRIIETGQGWRSTGGHDSIPVPRSLAGILRARIDRLLPEPKGDLLRASVLGSEFSDGLFMRTGSLLGHGPEKSRTNLEDLRRKGFFHTWESPGGSGHRFSHVLIRDAAYDMLLHRNRILLHRLAAEALEAGPEGARGDMASVIAGHWEKAGEFDRAIHWGERALSHCSSRLLSEEGIIAADRLIEWIGMQPDSLYRRSSLFEVMLVKEKFLGLLARREEQARLLEELSAMAGENPDSPWRVTVNGRLGRMHVFTGRLQLAREVLSGALAESGKTGDKALRGSILGDLAILCLKQGRPGESIQHSREALEIFRGLGDINCEIQSINSLGIACWDMERLEEALEHFTRANELSRDSRNRWFEANTLLNMGVIHRCLGDLRKARELYLSAVELNRETGNRHNEANAHANIGILAMLEGNPAEAEGHYRSALSIYRQTGNRLLELQTLSKLGRLLLETGDLAEAEACFNESLAMQAETGQTRDEAETLNSLSRLLIVKGCFDRAVPCLERALGASRASGDRNGELNALCMLAEAALSSGDAVAARGFRDQAGAFEHLIRDDEETGQRFTRLDAELKRMGG